MNTIPVALCLVLVAMASATYNHPSGPAARLPYTGGYPGNNVDNNQDFKQFATINQQQSNKQAVDQDYYRRGRGGATFRSDGSGYPGGYQPSYPGGYQPDYTGGYRPGYPSGNQGNDIYNNQYPEQVASINQQQSNKQAVDQDAISRGRYPGYGGYRTGGYRTGGYRTGGKGY